MVEDFTDRPTEQTGDRRLGRHSAVDGLIAGRNEVWVLLGRPGDNPRDLLWSEDDGGDGSTAMLCRQVLDHGVLVIGSVDRDNDPLLSQLLRGGECGTA
jgi:hypothetical protein